MNHLAQKVLSGTNHIVPPLLLVLLLATGTLHNGQDEPPPMSPNGDETSLDVVRKAQAGDESSFTTLYHWYYTRIYYYLLRMVGNHEDASDLAAETFTKAWRALPGILDGRRFSSWLYSIATHMAIDFLRRQKKDQALWDSLDENPNHEHTVRFEDWVEEEELVRLALMQVAPKPRACLLLQLEGFTQAEIAKLVGLRKKSVGTYVCTAREQFRRAYHQLQKR